MPYRAITISGLICTGKSSLFKLLEENLDWDVYSASRFFREWSRDHNLPLFAAELRPDDLTKEIDEGMREKLLREKNIILEGWLAGYMAQGVEGVYKILLTCNEEERVKRFAKRENVSLEEAKEAIKKREESLFAKWRKIYGREDFLDPKYYDLVIDTSDFEPEDTLNYSLKRLGE